MYWTARVHIWQQHAACLAYRQLPNWPKYDFFIIHKKSKAAKSTNFDIPKNDFTGGVPLGSGVWKRVLSEKCVV